MKLYLKNGCAISSKSEIPFGRLSPKVDRDCIEMKMDVIPTM